MLRSGIYDEAVDLILRHEVHLLNDKIIAVLADSSRLGDDPPLTFGDLSRSLVGRMSFLTEKRITRGTLFAAPITFANFPEGNADTVFILALWRPEPRSPVLAAHTDVVAGPRQGPFTLSFPNGVMRF